MEGRRGNPRRLLRGVYPELECILRQAQNERRARNDKKQDNGSELRHVGSS